jgi:hypothetical protein
MVAEPEATPVITPVDAPTVATEVLPLLQVPPDVASETVVVAPVQTVVVPVIADGAPLTVIAFVEKQASRE